jgi:hypothetical protein
VISRTKIPYEQGWPETKRKTTQAVKTTPHINQGKGITLVPGTVNSSTNKNKKEVIRDQEGCRLDLKPAPEES